MLSAKRIQTKDMFQYLKDQDWAKEWFQVKNLRIAV
jgi:hypothetical protein